MPDDSDGVSVLARVAKHLIIALIVIASSLRFVALEDVPPRLFPRCAGAARARLPREVLRYLALYTYPTLRVQVPGRYCCDTFA